MTRSKVNVFLNQGLADQKKWIFKRQFSIGRDSTADVCIKDPIVSRFHVFVYLVEGKWWIRDMNSSNGTLINGRQVIKSPVPVPAAEQTKLQLGLDGPALYLCSDNPDSSDTGTLIVDLSDVKKNNTHFFNMKNRVKKNIENSGNAHVSEDDNGYDEPPLNKWFKNIKTQYKISPIAASVIMIGLLLAGYISLKEDYGSAKSQSGIHITEKQTDAEEVRLSESEKADTQKISEGIQANRQVAQPIEPYHLNNPIDHGKHNPIDLQQQMIRDHTSDIYFKAAEKFFTHHRWQTALVYYQKALGIDPDHPRLNTEIAKVKFEIANQAAYQKARANLKEKRYEQCIAVLRNFPENSVYYQEVRELIDDAKSKIKAPLS